MFLVGKMLGFFGDCKIPGLVLLNQKPLLLVTVVMDGLVDD